MLLLRLDERSHLAFRQMSMLPRNFVLCFPCRLAEEALLKMVKLLGADSYDVQVNPGQFIIVTEMVRADGSKGSGENQRGTSYRHRRSEGGSSHSSPRSGVSGHNEGGNGRRRGSSAGRSHSRDGSSYGRVDSRSRSRSDSSHSDEDEHSQERSRVRSRSSSGSPDQDDGEFVERVLHFQCGNMFDVQNIKTADIVMMETDIPADCHGRLLDLLSQTRPGTRFLTYLDLRRLWANARLTFRQLEVNRHQADRYPTSWSVQRGHHFYLWTRVSGGSVILFPSVVGYGTVLHKLYRFSLFVRSGSIVSSIVDVFTLI
jgi:hypothetical protein